MGRLSILLLLPLLTSPARAAQQVRGGPPPEVRALVDEVSRALNDNAAAWEAFARSRFAAALLARHSPDERARVHARLQQDFGRLTVQRVTRPGPGAPIELHLAGERERGVLELDIEGEPAAPRITGLRVRLGDGPGNRETAGLPTPPVDGRLPAGELTRRLDAHFTDLEAREVFSGVVLAARLGQPVFVRAYGLADREQRVENTPRTRFNVGSINKVFTQIAIRQLVQEGRLRLTDALGSFFPEYPQAVSRAATIEQLLSHRGGLADFFGPDFEREPKSRFTSNADYFAFVSSLPPRFAPGERTEYCNGCYIALGAIVEKVSGMPYERYVTERIFARAGMSDTGYLRSDRPDRDMAVGYTRRGSAAGLRRNVDLHGVAGSAAGGGYSTAADLLAFVRAVGAGVFPDTPATFSVAGGAPGVSAVVEARGEWTVIVLTNLDPPTGEQAGAALADALSR